jgi:hypothetical protein
VVGIADLSLVKDWVQLSFWLALGVAAAATRKRALAVAGEGPSNRP